MLLSNRTVGGSHHRLRDAANILEEEEEVLGSVYTPESEVSECGA